MAEPVTFSVPRPPTEFERLLRVAADDAQRGDITAALILCDYLDERSDPRGLRLRRRLRMYGGRIRRFQRYMQAWEDGHDFGGYYENQLTRQHESLSVYIRRLARLRAINGFLPPIHWLTRKDRRTVEPKPF